MQLLWHFRALFALLNLQFLFFNPAESQKCKDPTSKCLDSCTDCKENPEFPIKNHRSQKPPPQSIYPTVVFTEADAKSPPPSGFKSSFVDSITIPMKGEKSCNAGCLFVSKTLGYNPQMRLWKRKSASSPAQWEEIKPTSNEKEHFFSMEQDVDYVIEVGTGPGESIPDAFPKRQKGEFMVVFTGTTTSLLGYFANETIMGSAGGWIGKIPVNADGSAFMVTSGNKKVEPISAGSLNMKITPSYDRKRDSLTLYYTKGSTYSGCSPRNTVYTFVCNDKKRDEEIFDTTEDKRCNYEGVAKSREICKLTRFLDAHWK